MSFKMRDEDYEKINLDLNFNIFMHAKNVPCATN